MSQEGFVYLAPLWILAIQNINNVKEFCIIPIQFFSDFYQVYLGAS